MAQLHYQSSDSQCLKPALRALKYSMLVIRRIFGAITLVGLLSVLCLTGGRATAEVAGEHSRVVHAGLRVEFSLRCKDHTVELRGVIANESAKPITIQSGSLPWQYDLLGSDFTAEASGATLERNEAAPILGRVGPITLAPRERRDGTVPISTLFPDLRKSLRDGSSVSIRWKYWTGVKSAGGAPFEGTIVMSQDPCGENR